MVVVQPPAQGLQLGDVHLLDIAEVRDAPLGLGHLLGDAAAKADDLHQLVGARTRRGSPRPHSAGAQHGVQILVGDPPARAGPAQASQVDPQPLGSGPHSRRGLGAG